MQYVDIVYNAGIEKEWKKCNDGANEWREICKACKKLSSYCKECSKICEDCRYCLEYKEVREKYFILEKYKKCEKYSNITRVLYIKILILIFMRKILKNLYCC